MSGVKEDPEEELNREKKEIVSRIETLSSTPTFRPLLVILEL